MYVARLFLGSRPDPFCLSLGGEHMDRSALFIDAGHLLAEGGAACLGTKSRKNIKCNYAGLLNDLEHVIRKDCGCPLLRTYWYDGARDRVPGIEHQGIALLPRVKLRLGQLTAHGQKGVDALIYHDLITLARERAIVTAYLLAGDEDLREGVSVTQQMGVMIVLFGIKTTEQNQSSALVAEADEHRWIPANLLTKHFSKVAAPAAPPATSPVAAPSAPAPPPTTKPGPVDTAPPLLEKTTMVGAAGELATRWHAAASQADKDRVRDALHRGTLIPPDVDRIFLRWAQERLGPLQDHPEARRYLRNALRDNLQSLLK
jgi:uncharacterized LabA/DUF88 family protein